jgi:hypothetical protein
MLSIGDAINSLRNEINKTYEKKNNINETYDTSNTQTILIDPRVDNNPLPNDSEITYKFGAMSYITDVYPGYTWRNGSWYKIKKTLEFKPHSAKRLVNFRNSVNTNNSVNFIDSINVKKLNPCAYINDAFVPFMHYDNRYFICIPNSPYQNKYYCNLYIPMYKGTCTLALWPAEIQNLKYEIKVQHNN